MNSKTKKQLADYFKKQKHVQLAYLFGSQATGKAGKLSDTDIAVLLDNKLTKKDMFEIRLKTISEVGQLLKTNELDIVILNIAPLSLKFEAIKPREHIFVRNDSIRSEFEYTTMKFYLDIKYFNQMRAEHIIKTVNRSGSL